MLPANTRGTRICWILTSRFSTTRISTLERDVFRRIISIRDVSSEFSSSDGDGNTKYYAFSRVQTIISEVWEKTSP